MKIRKNWLNETMTRERERSDTKWESGNDWSRRSDGTDRSKIESDGEREKKETERRERVVLLQREQEGSGRMAFNGNS